MNRNRKFLAVTGLAAVLAAACSPASSSDTTSSAAAGGDASSAAGGGDASSAAGGASGDLTIWSWRVEDQKAYEKIFATYTASHPGVKITVKTFKSTEYNTILATGLAGSDGPDIAQVRSYGQLQPTIESGSLVPLDGKVDLTGWDENVIKSAEGKKDGKLYSVPLAVQTLQMFYNKDLFSSAGIEAPPTTWAEFTDDISKLAAKGVTPIAVGAKDGWTLPIVHQVLATPRFGGTAFETAVLDGSKTFTDKDFVASLDVVNGLKDAFGKNVTGVAYTDAQSLFTNGGAAMFPGGSFELGFFSNQNPDLKMGVFQVPAPDGSPSDTPVTPGYADGAFGLSTKSKNSEAGLELLKWMATKDFGQQVVDEVKQLSAVPGVTYSDPLLQQMADNYKNSPTPYLLLTDFRYGTPSGTDLLGTGIQQLLLGDKDSAAVAKDLQDGLAAWFKPGS
ncbi:extracellular solute-binding protein [Nakamurella lactea]|uniref:extracellular solute-binding protein n=1 Tax=Nakamurella lactea TaxID=459515 RepID=UPI0004282369|nr:extracellular solute-binding protein [Nakamurella lactea]